MKNKFICLILTLSFLTASVSELAFVNKAHAENAASDIDDVISGNSASEEYPADAENIYEMQITDRVQAIPPELLDETVFDETDEKSTNTRENRVLTRDSLVNTNKTLWEEMMTTMFADDYFNPYRTKVSEEITSNTNQLKITETDLSLPGKNGLDLNIRRKYDNQDYSSYYVSERIGDVSTEIDSPCVVYRFNTSTGESIDIGFYTEDEFYIYMYNGCYVSDLSFSSDFSSDSSTGIGVLYQRIVDKQSTSGIKLTYDETVAKRLGYFTEKNLYYVNNVDLNVRNYSIGNGWSVDLPEAYARRDFDESQSNDYERIKTHFYSGVFVDIDGVLHTYTEMQELTIDKTTKESFFCFRD